jgi:hypothetical protein
VTTRAPGGIRIANGPRAVEAELVARVAALEAEALASLDFERPVLVVVPSRSLQLHVRSALVRAAGRARIGVEVQTLVGTARAIVERAGERVLHGSLLFPPIVEEEARREPALARELGGLQDGFAVLSSVVADPLDAGLPPEDVTALLAALPGSGREAERGRAIVRVAAAAQRRMREAGIGREADSLSRAAELLGRDADLLPARGVIVHGFADATGAATALIRALVRRSSACVLLDHPPDPSNAGAVDASARFTERLRERIGAEAAAAQTPPPPRAAIALVRAPSPTAEVRDVAERVRALLDAGVRPESIGIVARTLEPYALALRAQLGRLAIPYSGVGSLAPRGPLARRALATREVLLRGERTPVDVWLEALAESALSAERRADLRVGLHLIGAARLELVASLDVDTLLGGRGGLSLPVRRGLVDRTDADDEEADEADVPAEERSARVRRTVARKRWLEADTLEEAVASAHKLLARLADAQGERPLAAHLEALRALLVESLAWDPEEAARALEPLEEAPGDLRLDATAFGRVADTVLRDFGREPLGGAGGGVQVLEVIEARARTFEHLFLLGMHRDGFPRIVSDDALLPDAQRRSLLHALPDLALKERGHEEERYLFAQLLAASPRIVLSWAAADDEDRPRAPSPLVERLRLAPGVSDPEDARALFSRERHPGPRPAYEHAILAALYGARRRVEPAVAHALESRLGTQAARTRARARAAVLAELEPQRRAASSAASLGPYLGLVGPPRDIDPRHRELHVTTLEGVARCPWQTFVERLLPIDEVRDALEELPGLTPLLVGNLVHEALERIVHAALPGENGDLARAAQAPPVVVPWPEDAELEAVLGAAAEDVLLAAGIPHRGLARALARRARPYLEVARRDWSDGGPPAVGAELEGHVLAPGPDGARAIHFRADRVDRRGARLVLTDYKTGRPLSRSPKADTRAQHVAEGIARGQALQAAAYALAEGLGGALGRYFFLRPDAPADTAVLEVDGAGEALREVFEGATRTILAGWELGAFVPRLVRVGQAGPPAACRWCRVRTACVQGDPVMRRRLRAFAECDEPSADALDRALRRMLVDLEPAER